MVLGRHNSPAPASCETSQIPAAGDQGGWDVFVPPPRPVLGLPPLPPQSPAAAPPSAPGAVIPLANSPWPRAESRG
jgi:hypothetical protein